MKNKQVSHGQMLDEEAFTDFCNWMMFKRSPDKRAHVIQCVKCRECVCMCVGERESE